MVIIALLVAFSVSPLLGPSDGAHRQVEQFRLEQLAQPLPAAAAALPFPPPERELNLDGSRRSRRLPQRGHAAPLPPEPMRHKASNSWSQAEHLNSYIGTLGFLERRPRAVIARAAHPLATIAPPQVAVNARE
jgi:hypothetical protein